MFLQIVGVQVISVVTPKKLIGPRKGMKISRLFGDHHFKGELTCGVAVIYSENLMVRT
jgi:hypothetical protein